MRKLYEVVYQLDGAASVNLKSRNIVLSILLLLLPVLGFSQAVGDYQSHQTGNWTVTSTWEQWNGTTWVTPAPTVPTNWTTVVTIRSPHVVSMITSETDNASASLVVNGTLAISTTIPVKVLTINGSLKNNGSITGASIARLKFTSGSNYYHLFIDGPPAIPTAIIPAATWDTNSTVNIVGYDATGGSNPPGGLTQTFGNFTWNTPTMAAGSGVSLNAQLNHVTGNFSVIDAGSSALFYSFAGAGGTTMTVGGNFNVNSTFGFSSADSGPSTLNVAGDINLGTSINPGSADGLIQWTDFANVTVTCKNINITGTPSTTFDFSAAPGANTNITLTGNFTQTGSSIVEASGGSGTFEFGGTVKQIYSSTIAAIGDVNYTVDAFSILSIAGANFIGGDGTFTLNPNATLYVGSTDVNGAIQNTTGGNIQVTGTKTFGALSTIVYNGTAAQKLGAGFPSSVTNPVNLEIANATGVTNGNTSTTLTLNNLTLTSGTYSIGTSTTTNVGGAFTVTGGNISGNSTSSLAFNGSLSGTLSFNSGTEFLKNFTNGTSSDIVMGSDLTISGILSFTNTGNLDFSSHNLTITGSGIASSGGGGLKSNGLSNLTFAGSTFSGNVPYVASSQINILTFNTTGGTYNWNSLVVINFELFLSNGVLTNSSGLTMGNNAIVIRSGGSMTAAGGGQPLSALSIYNVTYNSPVATGIELPTNATTLNNLFINSSGTVTLTSSGITINGDLTANSGTFDAGAHPFTLKGNFFSISNSILTASPITFAGTTTISGAQSPVFGDVTINGSSTVNPMVSYEINGNLVNNGTLAPGTGLITTTFGGTTTISGSSVSAFNNLTITGTLTAPTGAGSFSVAGDFTNNGTFNNSNSIVVFNGVSTIVGTVPNFGSITIQGSLTAPAILNVAKNFTNNGTFTAGLGLVNFNGTSIQQSITGTSVTDFNNINITNIVGSLVNPSVQVESSQNILGVLTLSAGAVFDADGSANTSIFTVRSRADGSDVLNTVGADASIATIPPTSAVTGSVTVQRHMDIEGPNSNRIYRYISSAVQNGTVMQIQATVPVTGPFTGSSSCSGCGTNQSMFAYDETVPGPQDLGYINFPAASNTETLAPGRGYAMYERGNVDPILSDGSGLWSVRGPINVGNVTPISFPLTYTNTGSPADDGWNLIGNPFPSTIDWNAATGWTKSPDISATIYMTDNAAGPSGTSTVFATWNGSVGTNGGSQNIAMGQAFFVKSDGSSTPSITATEDVKVGGTQTIFFRQSDPQNYLRITMSQNGNTDEALIAFRDDATDHVDKIADAYKLKNSIFNLSSLSQNTRLAINSLHTISCTQIVKLSVADVTPGKYQLTFANMKSFTTGIQILLHDSKGDGSWIDVTANNSYDFDVTADTTTYGTNRFSVSFGYGDQLPSALDVTAAGVCSTSDSQIVIANSSTSVTYFANINGTSVTPITAGNGKDLTLTVSKSLLKFGANAVEIVAQSPNCSTLTFSQPISVQVDSIYSVKSGGAQSCQAGAVTLTAKGAPLTGTYNWYADNTDASVIFSGASFTTPVLEKTKTYFVAAANAFGCEGTRVAVIATVVNFDPASISLVNENTFQSNFATGNTWYLNDVLLSDTTATLKIKSNGTYKLLVNVKGCITSDEKTFSVTGLGESASGISGYPNPVGGNNAVYTVELPDPGNELSELGIMNSLGTKIGTMQLNAQGTVKKGQYDFSSQPSGFYFVKVAIGSAVTVLKIIKK